MEHLRRLFILFLSLFSIGVVPFGISRAMHSKLFTLQEINVESSLENPPLDDDVVLKIAAVPIGTISLFDVDLKSIERRLLANDLIKAVSLQKKIPHTLSIEVTYKVPQAVIQEAKGTLFYIDSEGKVFGSLNLASAPDLPILFGFANQGSERIQDALTLLRKWENSQLGRMAMISSIYWNSERGFRVLVTYSLDGSFLTSSVNLNNRMRAMVDFGQRIDENLNDKLVQLLKVFRYLSGNSIAARQVWADAGKKIVVKTAHGS